MLRTFADITSVFSDVRILCERELTLLGIRYGLNRYVTDSASNFNLYLAVSLRGRGRLGCIHGWVSKGDQDSTSGRGVKGSVCVHACGVFVCYIDNFVSKSPHLNGLTD